MCKWIHACVQAPEKCIYTHTQQLRSWPTDRKQRLKAFWDRKAFSQWHTSSTPANLPFLIWGKRKREKEKKKGPYARRMGWADLTGWCGTFLACWKPTADSVKSVVLSWRNLYQDAQPMVSSSVSSKNASQQQTERATTEGECHLLGLTACLSGQSFSMFAPSLMLKG